MIFVETDPGVRLEVLDWGGQGDTIVLLAGLGNTAHVYDDFAPRLIDHFHVVGLTRRGAGASSAPGVGYDIRTLANDLRAVIDALGNGPVDLVGHSIGGAEISTFAVQYPTRLRKAVYLDSAYDYVGYGPVYPAPLAATEQDLKSAAAFRAYRARIIALQPEAEIRATLVFDEDGRVLRNRTPPGVMAAISGSVTHPAYAEMKSPALAIYALPLKPSDLAPSYDGWSAENKARFDPLFEAHLKWEAEQRRRFETEIPRGRAVELPGSGHYVFIAREAQVLDEMRRFLSEP